MNALHADASATPLGGHYCLSFFGTFSEDADCLDGLLVNQDETTALPAISGCPGRVQDHYGFQAQGHPQRVGFSSLRLGERLDKLTVVLASGCADRNFHHFTSFDSAYTAGFQGGA